MQHSIHFDTRMIRAYHKCISPRIPCLKHQSAIHTHGSLSSYRFLIYDKILRNRNRCCSAADWKPLDGILVVKWPRGNNREERERGAAKSNVDGELDVLEEVPDEEGDDLDGRC